MRGGVKLCGDRHRLCRGGKYDRVQVSMLLV